MKKAISRNATFHV